MDQTDHRVAAMSLKPQPLDRRHQVREVLQQGGAAAQEALQHARTAAEPQLAQARAMADKQAQHLSKVLGPTPSKAAPFPIRLDLEPQTLNSFQCPAT